VVVVAAVLVGLVEPKLGLTFVEHYNLVVMKEPFVVVVAVVVVLKQSMDTDPLVDAVGASMSVAVERVVVVAFHRHSVVVSSFVEVAVAVDPVVDNHHVDNPFLDYYTSFVHLMKDHMVVAFHYQLSHMDASAFALVDIVVVDDPFDVDVLVEVVDNLDMDLEQVVAVLAVIVVEVVKLTFEID
jgi:hypothetical protein